MTDITVPDRYGLRPPMRVVPAEPSPTVEHDRERTPTWLEYIAEAVAHLTYGEMKEFAAGVLAKEDQAEIIVLADKLHAWADRTKVPQ